MKKIKLEQETLDKWARMTDNNEHTDVRIEIAKKFRIDKLECKEMPSWWITDTFKTEKLLHEKYKCGNLSGECIATRLMFKLISDNYGADIAEKVYDCL